MTKPVKWKRTSNGLQSPNKVQRWAQLEKTSEIAVWIVQIRQEMTEILHFSHFLFLWITKPSAHLFSNCRSSSRPNWKLQGIIRSVNLINLLKIINLCPLKIFQCFFANTFRKMLKASKNMKLRQLFLIWMERRRVSRSFITYHISYFAFVVMQ